MPFFRPVTVRAVVSALLLGISIHLPNAGVTWELSFWRYWNLVMTGFSSGVVQAKAICWSPPVGVPRAGFCVGLGPMVTPTASEAGPVPPLLVARAWKMWTTLLARLVTV